MFFHCLPETTETIDPAHHRGNILAEGALPGTTETIDPAHHRGNILAEGAFTSENKVHTAIHGWRPGAHTGFLPGSGDCLNSGWGNFNNARVAQTLFHPPPKSAPLCIWKERAQFHNSVT